MAGRCEPLARDSGIDASSDGGRLDAGPPGEDSGPDAGTDEDAGVDGGLPPPAHCDDGSLSGDETDTDCGGSCSPCWMCRRCVGDTDCARGACNEGRCEPELTNLPAGRVFQREDGALLLAHYAPNVSLFEYDPRRRQFADVDGGGDAPSTWAPDPCISSGHVAFPHFDSGAFSITMSCGTSLDSLELELSSSDVFVDLALGDKGTVGASGSPGWGVLAARSSSTGRTQRGICGADPSDIGGGVGYCSGAPGRDANLISFASYDTGGSRPVTSVSCGARTCSRPGCDIEVWLWLVPM